MAQEGEHFTIIYIYRGFFFFLFVFLVFLFLCALLSVIKQFQFGIGRKIESNIVWQKVQRTTALTQLRRYTCRLSGKEKGENTLPPALSTGRQRQKAS